VASMLGRSSARAPARSERILPSELITPLLGRCYVVGPFALDGFRNVSRCSSTATAAVLRWVKKLIGPNRVSKRTRNCTTGRPIYDMRFFSAPVASEFREKIAREQRMSNAGDP